MGARTVNLDTHDEIAGVAKRVARSGERVVMEHGGEVIAAIVPLEDLARLEETDASARTPRQRLLDDLVRMDDEAGRYAVEAEKAARTRR